MIPQQKNFLIDAMRVGEYQLKLELAIAKENGDKAVCNKHGKRINKIRAAIKELEAMPTEEVK